MSQEKLLILEMLKEGKISTEEALALLGKVDGDERARAHAYHREYARRPSPPTDFGWINDLRDAVQDTARNVFQDIPYVNERRELFYADTGSESGGRALAFIGKNAPVRLEPYDGDKIEVEVLYRERGQWDPRIGLTEDGGVLSVSFDDNALYSIGMNIRVPKAMQVGSARLQTKNAQVALQGLAADRIEAYTTNSYIHIAGVRAQTLTCETRNAAVTLIDVNARDIDAKTTNAKITLEAVTARSARLDTSNAKISVQGADIVQLSAKTTNAGLQFEQMAFKQSEPLYSIEAITKNARINLSLPLDAPKCKLRASTTSGGIYTTLKSMDFQVSAKNYLEANSHDYDSAQQKLTLNLQTTNGSIHVEQ